MCVWLWSSLLCSVTVTKAELTPQNQQVGTHCVSHCSQITLHSTVCVCVCVCFDVFTLSSVKVGRWGWTGVYKTGCGEDWHPQGVDRWEREDLPPRGLSSCLQCDSFDLCCVSAVLQTELTRLLDKQGTNLFDLYNPEVLPRDVSPLRSCSGFTVVLVFERSHWLCLSVPLSVPMLQGYVVIQMDFGFPHHLLVEFLQRTLQ